jgi:serine/threonine-protein kinase RsbW
MERETAKAMEGESGFQDPISLTLPSSPEYVLLARLVMGQAGRLAGLEPDEVYDLKLAVTEAVTNVIRHASVESYEIEYRMLPSGIEVSVTDTGGGFSIADLTAEPGEHGGFGLAVIRNLVDELVLDSTRDGGTRLKMIRRVGG